MLKSGALLIIFCLAFVAQAIGASLTLPSQFEDARLELLVASPSSAQVDSIAGHVALGIKVFNTDKTITQYALSFMAADNNEKGTKFYVKSVVGTYPIMAILEDYSDYFRRNVFLDNRKVRRFVIDSDEKKIRSLFSRLEQFKTEKNIGSYAFFSKNCATYLYQFLNEIGYFTNSRGIHSNLPITPVNLQQMLLTPVMLGQIELPTSRTGHEIFEDIANKVGLKNNDLKNSENLEALTAKVQLLSNLEINFLLSLNLSKHLDLKQNLREELRGRPGKRRFSELEVIGVVDYPREIYKICANLSCSRQKMEILRTTFGQSYTHDLRKKIYSDLMRTRQLIFFSDLSKTEQYQNADLLYKALLEF